MNRQTGPGLKRLPARTPVCLTKVSVFEGHSSYDYGERFHKVVSSSRSGMVASFYVSLVLSLAFLHMTDMQKIFLGTGELS